MSLQHTTPQDGNILATPTQIGFSVKKGITFFLRPPKTETIGNGKADIHAPFLIDLIGHDVSFPDWLSRSDVALFLKKQMASAFRPLGMDLAKY